MGNIYKNETEKAEKLGRQYFELSFPNYEKTYSTDDFSWWDVSGYTSSNQSKLKVSQPFIGEIKVRYNHLDEYKTIMIEKYKYDSLTDYSKSSGIPPFYINYFVDKQIVINLNKVDISKCESELKWLPEYSETNVKTWVQKWVYYLPKEQFDIKDKGQKYYNLQIRNSNAKQYNTTSTNY